MMQVAILRLLKENKDIPVSTKELKERFGKDIDQDLETLEKVGLIVSTKETKKFGKFYTLSAETRE